MLEKLIQAAFITLLLQIIAVLSVNSPIRYKTAFPISTTPTSVASSTLSASK